ncbi:MAG: hypothetical protein ABI539_08635 [Acidobacteriota bacterium]
MNRLFTALIVISWAFLGFACGTSNVNSNVSSPGVDTGSSPTESFKRLYAAVKEKNTAAIKQQMSKNSIDFAMSVAAQQKSPEEKVFENGFTATTFSASLPEIRDERINGSFGAIEVWNSKDSIWEDLPFVLEDGSWKFAIGELFGGKFQSPGPGRDKKEKEAANVARAADQPRSETNSNTNKITKMNVPQPPKSEQK